MSAADFASRYPWYMHPATAAALIKRSQARRKQALIERELAARVAQRFEGFECVVLPFPGRQA